MRSLSSTLRSFEPPRLTAEQRAANEAAAAEHERRMRECDRLARIGRSGIPKAYRRARLSDCDPAVLAWFADGMPTGLLLQGGFGCGKTFAACAVLVRAACDRTVRFATADAMLRDCRGAFDGRESERAVMGRYLCCGVLAIDDLGKERLTEWGLAALFAVVDGRGGRGLPTVVTTNYTGRDLLAKMTVGGDATTAKAIISRMCAYRRVVVGGGDRRAGKERA